MINVTVNSSGGGRKDYRMNNDATLQQAFEKHGVDISAPGSQLSLNGSVLNSGDIYRTFADVLTMQGLNPDTCTSVFLASTVKEDNA